MPCPTCGRLSAAHVHAKPPPTRRLQTAYPQFAFIVGGALGFLVGLIAGVFGS